MLKGNVKHRERVLRLSDMGKTMLSHLLQVPHSLPELPAIEMKLRRFSKRILRSAPISNKYFRNPWKSWLLFYYPDMSLQIALSQEHITITQCEHYLNIHLKKMIGRK